MSCHTVKGYENSKVYGPCKGVHTGADNGSNLHGPTTVDSYGARDTEGRKLNKNPNEDNDMINEGNTMSGLLKILLIVGAIAALIMFL